MTAPGRAGAAGSADVAAEGEDGVEAAEGERVGEREVLVWGEGARFFGDDVEVERGVDLMDASSERQAGSVEREDGRQRFDGSGGADGVAGKRLGGSNRNAWSKLAERLVDRGGLYGVVDGRAKAVSIDVADARSPGLTIHAWGAQRGRDVFQRAAHGKGWALGARLGNVVGVGGHAKADDLGVDACAAAPGRVERFDDEHRRTFAEG